jgi:hypothetical protein
MTGQCATCPAVIRRTTGLPLCRPCNDLAEQAFRREHSPADTDWLAQRSLFFGNTVAVIAAVQTELQSPVAVGA